MRSPLLLLLALGCAGPDVGPDGDGDEPVDDIDGSGTDDTDGGDTDGFDTDGSSTDDCEYPDFTDPMTLGEAIAPYRWPTAIHADGRELPIKLGNVPCATDPDIDWSPFDVLMFVSIPAW